MLDPYDLRRKRKFKKDAKRKWRKLSDYFYCARCGYLTCDYEYSHCSNEQRPSHISGCVREISEWELEDLVRKRLPIPNPKRRA